MQGSGPVLVFRDYWCMVRARATPAYGLQCGFPTNKPEIHIHKTEQRKGETSRLQVST